MTTNDQIRASDGDRDAVVAILRDAYTAGRLTLPEFDERTSAAFTCRTWGELRELTTDLPEQPRLGPLPEQPRPGPARQAVPVPGQRWPGRGGAGRLVPALPIVFFWIAISLFARGPGAYVPIVILLLIGLKVAGSHRQDDDVDYDPRQARQPHQPGRPGPPF